MHSVPSAVGSYDIGRMELLQRALGGCNSSYSADKCQIAVVGDLRMSSMVSHAVAADNPSHGYRLAKSASNLLAQSISYVCLFVGKHYTRENNSNVTPEKRSIEDQRYRCHICIRCRVIETTSVTD